jgi:porin
MIKQEAVLSVAFLFTFSGISLAVHPEKVLTDGLNAQLAEFGLDVGFGVTNIYQMNTKGGTGTHKNNGRYTGSYDLEISADLQKLLGLDAGILFLHLEGGWPDAEGIDPRSVESTFGVNADAIGNDHILVKQLFYEGPFFDESLMITIGKIDFTGVFDKNAYADDEITQFLNAAFVDDPTIPFPQYSLGAILTWNLNDNWYFMAGAADAQADSRETGFRTAFHKEDYFFYALETGVTAEISSENGSLPGAYRVGLWNDPQPKANSDAVKNYRDDVGIYTSCDQMFHKENTDHQDTQGLGVFFRYGYAPSKTNDITNFLSFGFQYQGLFNGRDDDILGVAFARGFFCDSADAAYSDDYENAVELYYNAQLTEMFNVSPAVQYITNPGGGNASRDAVVLGVRVQMTF